MDNGKFGAKEIISFDQSLLLQPFYIAPHPSKTSTILLDCLNPQHGSQLYRTFRKQRNRAQVSLFSAWGWQYYNHRTPRSLSQETEAQSGQETCPKWIVSAHTFHINHSTTSFPSLKEASKISLCTPSRWQRSFLSGFILAHSVLLLGELFCLNLPVKSVKYWI